MEPFKLESPLRVKKDLDYYVTPFGVYCNICNCPVGNLDGITNTLLRKHSSQKKHINNSEMDFINIAKLLNNKIKDEFAKCQLNEWYYSKEITTYSCLCGLCFRNKSNHIRHVKKMLEKGDLGKHDIVCIILAF